MAVRKKLRRVKRFAYLGGFVGLAVGVKRLRDRRPTGPAPFGPPTTWPPLEPGADVPVAAVGSLVDAAARPDAATATWVPPLDDGSCPLSHPIKANDNSQIFHSPGGRFYERTRAERCYADAASAQADGYRAAKGAGHAEPGGAS